ncbi:MAG: PAS domain S-box protein, partial [Deltaproteobacteria bacterium]|nr:PAS domain S-box protein [Deltaproteobacteria bacterium]
MSKLGANEAAQDYASIFNTTSDGIFYVNHDGIISRINPAFTEILGYKEHEILGSPFLTLIYKRQEKVKEILSQNLFNTPRFQMAEKAGLEMILFDKDGNNIPVRFRAIVKKDNHGQIYEAIGIIRHLVELGGTGGGSVLDEKMWEAQQNFDNVLNTSPDAILIANITGNIVTANKTLCQMLGYTQDEMIGMHVVEFASFEGTYDSTTGEDITIDEEYISNALNKTSELFEKGSVSSWEAFYVRKDKVLVPVEVTMSMLQDKGGERRGSIVIARDITERKKAENTHKQDENRLRETKEYLDNLIDSSLDGIIVSDNAGNVTRVNKSFLELIGFEKEEVIGKHIMELSIMKEGTYESTTGDLVEINDKFFNDSMEMSVKLFEEGKVSQWESYYYRKDRKIVPVEMETSHICDEKGDDIGSVGICRDITERKMAEKEIREARDFLENIFKTTADGIIVTDNEGFITKVNDAMEEITGYPRAELLKQHVTLFTPTDNQQYSEGENELEKLVQEGMLKEKESLLKRKDGQCIIIETNMSLLFDKKGQSLGCVGINRDITERKKMEQQLIQSEILKSLGELAGGVAHD